MNRTRPARRARQVAILAGAVLAGVAVAYAVRRRVSFQGNVVVITGASRGLGLELARQFAAEGARLAICARSAADVSEALDELRAAGAEVYGQACDVTEQAQVEAFVAAVLARFGTVDVLVNNAGVIQVGPQACMTLDDYRRSIDTHFWGPLYTTLAVLPHMRERRAGRIVNIASIGGKISVPHLLPYSAGKFALVGWSEGLHAELAREGIAVTTVCPGLMRTGSAVNADFKGRHREEYAWFSISGSLPPVAMDSRRAARQIVNACRRGAAEVTLTVSAKIAARLGGLFPGATAALLGLVNRLLPKPGGRGANAAKGWQSFSRWSPSLLTTLNDRAARRNREMP